MSERRCPNCDVPLRKGTYVWATEKPISVLKLDGTWERRTLSTWKCDACHREEER